MRNDYLTAKWDIEEEEEDFKEVTLKHLRAFTKEYLPQGLLNCVRYEQDYLSKIKSPRRTIKV